MISGVNLSNVGINQPESLLQSTSTLAILSRNFQTAQVEQSGALRTMKQQVSSFQDELKAFQKLSQSSRLSRTVGFEEAAVSGTTVFAFSTTEAFSTLVSTEEINTDTSSFSPTNPPWLGTSSSGASTANVTVSGLYAGPTSDTLTVEVARNVTVGGGGVAELEIYDGTGALIDTVSWSPGAPPGTIVTSAVTGLEFSLDIGDLYRQDTFELVVEAGTNQEPVLTDVLGSTTSLGSGVTISTGSFTVNGEVISVDASVDTLQDVLDAISASSAGVVATYADEGVTLTADTPGADPIVVADDTTGLLAALKLDGATSTEGSADEPNTAMADVDDLSGISAGSFTINGETITIDPTTDSISDVLSAINASSADVVATLSDGAVSLTGVDDASIVLASDTTGFLSTVGLSEGTTEATGGTVSQRGSRQAARKISKAFIGFAEKLNEIFARNDELDEHTRVDRIGMQSKIRGTITAVLDDRDMALDDNILDVTFVLSDEDTTALTLRRADIRRMEKSMISNPKEVDRLLFGSANTEGLIDQLVTATEDALTDLDQALKDMGNIFNSYA